VTVSAWEVVMAEEEGVTVTVGVTGVGALTVTDAVPEALL
jgi:hypothetical protein